MRWATPSFTACSATAKASAGRHRLQAGILQGAIFVGREQAALLEAAEADRGRGHAALARQRSPAVERAIGGGIGDMAARAPDGGRGGEQQQEAGVRSFGRLLERRRDRELGRENGLGRTVGDACGMDQAAERPVDRGPQPHAGIGRGEIERRGCARSRRDGRRMGSSSGRPAEGAARRDRSGTAPSPGRAGHRRPRLYKECPARSVLPRAAGVTRARRGTLGTPFGQAQLIFVARQAEHGVERGQGARAFVHQLDAARDQRRDG